MAQYAIASTHYELDKTRPDKQIRAVSNNPELCNIYGFDSDKLIL
jgi:branched-subunit amino acid ABC-type transport system permease component